MPKKKDTEHKTTLVYSKFENSLKCIVRIAQKTERGKEKKKKGRVKEGKHGAYREH